MTLKFGRLSVSLTIDRKNILRVLINYLKTVEPTQNPNHANCDDIFEFLRQLALKCINHLKRCVDNFEISHKSFSILVWGALLP